MIAAVASTFVPMRLITVASASSANAKAMALFTVASMPNAAAM